MKARVRGEEGNDDVQSVLKWVLRHRPESFTVRDLTRDLSKTFRNRAQPLELALAWLVKHNCIRERRPPARPTGSPGRTKSRVYDVNPNLLAPQNCQNPATDLLAKVEDEEPGDSGDFATDPPARYEQEVADDAPPF